MKSGIPPFFMVGNSTTLVGLPYAHRFYEKVLQGFSDRGSLPGK
jgi:hypothetical protein